jgi:raffinose/stachyose/melibiose transport system substrate-binding protein
MKKVLLTAVMVLSIMPLVFAGGGSQASQSQPGQIELKVCQIADESNPNYQTSIQRLWDPFIKANPDIKITREVLADEAYHQKISAYAASGQLPDVMVVWPSGRSSALHDNKLLKDLIPFIDRDNLRAEFSKDAFDPKMLGNLYSMVDYITFGFTITHVLYANTAVLKDCGLNIPKTYAELKAQVPVLKAKGYDTITMGNQDIWVMQSCLFSMIAGRFGGIDWEQKILSGQAKLTDPDFVNALAFVKTLYDDGVLSRAVLTTDQAASRNQFANNRAAYYIDGDWAVGSFITDKSTGRALIPPAKQESDIVLTVFPDIPGAKINRTTTGVLGNGWGMSASIPSGSAKEEAAWKLVKWLTGPEAQAWEAESSGHPIPSRTNVDVSKLPLEPMQRMLGNFNKEYDNFTCIIDINFHSDIYNLINDGMSELGFGTRTPQQVAQAAQAALDNWRNAQ